MLGIISLNVLLCVGEVSLNIPHEKKCDQEQFLKSPSTMAIVLTWARQFTCTICNVINKRIEYHGKKIKAKMNQR